MLGIVVGAGSLPIDTFADDSPEAESLGPACASATCTIAPTSDLALDIDADESLAAAPVERKILLDNEVYQALTGGSVTSSKGQPVSLPGVLKPHQLDTRDMRMIESLALPADTRSRFFRNSTVSPTLLSIYEAQPAGEHTRLYHVDITFVVFGGLKLVQSDSFLLGMAQGLLQAGANDREFKSRFLKRRDLAQRGIELTGADEHIIHNRFKIWDRLIVSATSHVEVTRDENSMLTAAILDTRFIDDEKFPTQWQPIHRNAVGHLQYGDPQPYCRGGFYFHLTELPEPAGAVLVEYHQLFEEPHGWFGGANLLRSKLPLFVPVGIQYFREQLKVAGREKINPDVLFR